MISNPHKAHCAINISCAVYHSDGICNDFRKCDCGAGVPPSSPTNKGECAHLHCKTCGHVDTAHECHHPSTQERELRSLIDNSTTITEIPTPDNWKCPKANCSTDFYHIHPQEKQGWEKEYWEIFLLRDNGGRMFNFIRQQITEAEHWAVAEHDAKWHPIVGTRMQNRHDYDDGYTQALKDVEINLETLKERVMCDEASKQWTGFNCAIYLFKGDITKLLATLSALKHKE